MNTYWLASGEIVMEAGEMDLHMSREEAEQLFVNLGHTLQDQDINLYADESGETEPQPEIEGAVV